VLILKVLEGAGPADAAPILVTSDEETIAAVGRVLGKTLARRLGADANADGERLRLLHGEKGMPPS